MLQTSSTFWKLIEERRKEPTVSVKRATDPTEET